LNVARAGAHGLPPERAVSRGRARANSGEGGPKIRGEGAGCLARKRGGCREGRGSTPRGVLQAGTRCLQSKAEGKKTQRNSDGSAAKAQRTGLDEDCWGGPGLDG